MGDAGLVVVALAVAVGLVGTVLPVLPGSALIGVAALAWAAVEGGSAWAFLAGVLALLVAGQVATYLVPGQRLARSGVPRTTLLLAAAVGVVGFFVVPVVGLPLGFAAAVLLAESVRARRQGLGAGAARASAVAVLKAVVLSVGIEALAGTLAAATWVTGALVLRG